MGNRFVLRVLGSVLLASALTGCSSLHFFWQAGMGQMKLVNRARPIAQVLKDERTPPSLRNLLKEVSGIKAFASEVGLKPTSNYEDFVQWDDDAVVWVVTASHRLRLEPKLWSFPVVGSFNYLGWFSKSDAREMASQLENEGWDVYVRGASAYSTLGWFRDPVLSTMLGKGDAAMGDLVNVLVHESVHASLYFANQSVFNESLADFLADYWTPLYLEKRFGKESSEFRQYRTYEAHSEARGKQMKAAYEKLENLYASDRNESDKLQEKRKILEQLQKDLAWKGPLNNATLIQMKTYGSGKAEFRAVFESCGSRWPDFWAKMTQIRDSDFTSPQKEDFGAILLQKKC